MFSFLGLTCNGGLTVSEISRRMRVSARKKSGSSGERRRRGGEDEGRQREK